MQGDDHVHESQLKVEDISVAFLVYLNVDDTSVRAGNGSSHSQGGP